MAEELLTLDTYNPQTPEPIQIDVGESSPPVQPDVASDRAAKAHYGLREKINKEYVEYFNNIIDGKEAELRKSVAAELDFQKRMQSYKAVEEVSKRTGQTLTPEEAQSIIDRVQQGGTHPDAVFEEGFARKYIDNIYSTVYGQTAGQDEGQTVNYTQPAGPGPSWFTDALASIPGEVKQTEEKASDLVTKLEVARKFATDIQGTVDEQSYAGYIADRLKGLVPFYDDIKQRGNVPGVGVFTGVLLGENKEEQYKTLLRLPMNQYIETLKNIKENLVKDNPGVALEFFSGLMGQSTRNMIADDAFNVIDATTLPIAASSKALIRKVRLYNQTQTLYKEMVKSVEGATKEAIDVAAKEATGDLREAAIKKTTEDVAKEFAGTSEPVKESVEALPSLMKASAKKIETDTGNMSREGVNRIKESYNSLIFNLMSTLGDISRVERLTGVAKIDAAVRNIYDKIKSLYPGMDNDFLDFSKPKKDPYLNTWSVDAYLGQGGKLFPSEKGAHEYADWNGLAKSRTETTPETFKTATKSYEVTKTTGVDEAGRTYSNLTTVRTEADGAKPKSVRTVFVKPEDVKYLTTTKKTYRITENADGSLSLRVPNPKTGYKTLATGTPINAPTKGWVPVELYDLKKGGYASHHIGDEITDIIPSQTRITAAAGYTVEPKGTGFFIRINQPINETWDAVRDFLVHLNPGNETPDSWMKVFSAWLSPLRTPEETLSLEQRMNRKIATYAPAALLKVVKENVTSMKELAKFKNKGLWKDWERVVKNARNEIDPVTQEKGYFYETIQQVEDAYLRMFKRTPEEIEVRAYFDYVRVLEVDHALRNIAMYRNLHRVGAKQHNVFVFNAKGEREESGFFNGVRQSEFPGGHDDTVAIFGTKDGQTKVGRVGTFDSKTLEDVREKVKTGRYSVIQIHAPEQYPLQGFNKIQSQRVRYIIAPNVEEKPIAYQQLPKRGGGHFDYDYTHYIKQAKINPEFVSGALKHWYEGDATLMPIANRAMGKDIAERLNRVVTLMKENKMDEAKLLLSENFPFEWKEFYSWFQPGYNPLTGKKVPPRFNMDEPFQITERGKMIVDVDNDLINRYNYTKPNGTRGNSFEDGTKRGSLNRQFQVQYTGERDAYEVFSLRNEGSIQNPVYQHEPAKLLDPIPSMNRALNSIVNSTFMDDYKIFSVEHWLEEAKKWLKVNDPSELRYAPFWHFENKKWLSNAPAEEVRKLDTAWWQIKQFIGTPSKVDTALHSISQKLADSVYTRTGKVIDPSWTIPFLRDPSRFFRAVAFNAKLGFFALPQIWVQSQTYVTIAGIAGFSKAIPGTYGAMLHQMSRLNPGMIDALDRMASRLHIPGAGRFKPGEFKEALLELEKTGFAHVGNELSMVDNVFAPKLISRSTDKFLNAGQVFFREGERNVRYGAWYTAYMEYRAKNPIGRITELERRQILERADLLYTNMSRASSSMLQHGIFSIPFQFLSYQMRAAELFIGKRLNGVERARLFATYATVYGFPTALGVTGIPFGDWYRKEALAQGYVVGDKYWSSLINEGVPSVALALLTGKYWNIGERFGTQGFEPLREAFRSDRTMWDIFGGASLSILSNTWANSDGFRKAMMAFIKGDPKMFPMKLQDVTDIFKEVSGINNNFRMFAAINTGRILSRRDTWLDDVTPFQSVLMGITGLQPQQVSDLNLLSWNKKSEEEFQKYTLDKFVQEFRRGLASMKDDNPDEARRFWSRAYAYLSIGGYPQERIHSAVLLAIKDNESLVDRINWDYFMKDVPEDQKEKRLDAFKRILRK